MARGVLTADSDGAAEEAASPGLLGTEGVGADPAVSGPALGRAHRSLILELQAFLGFISHGGCEGVPAPGVPQQSSSTRGEERWQTSGLPGPRGGRPLAPVPLPHSMH